MHKQLLCIIWYNHSHSAYWASCDCCVQYQWYASLCRWRWIVVVLMSARLVRPEWVSWRPPVSAQDTPCSEPATHEPTQPANLRAYIPIIIQSCRWLIATAFLQTLASFEHSTQPFTNPCELWQKYVQWDLSIPDSLIKASIISGVLSTSLKINDFM